MKLETSCAVLVVLASFGVGCAPKQRRAGLSLREAQSIVDIVTEANESLGPLAENVSELEHTAPQARPDSRRVVALRTFGAYVGTTTILNLRLDALPRKTASALVEYVEETQILEAQVKHLVSSLEKEKRVCSQPNGLVPQSGPPARDADSSFDASCSSARYVSEIDLQRTVALLRGTGERPGLMELGAHTEDELRFLYRGWVGWDGGMRESSLAGGEDNSQ